MAISYETLVLILTAILAVYFAMRPWFHVAPAKRMSKTPAMQPPVMGTLEADLRREAENYPGLSHVRVIASSLEAFAVRADLMSAAQRCIDAQYYMWRTDLAGRMMLHALLRAADRGVKVRLLLDDSTTKGDDAVWAALQQHPNINIRLFNPFRWRFPRLVNFLFDFGRLNRRMHNKCLIVDGCAVVAGGRNIANEYFAASDGMQFTDYDVLATGAVAAEAQHHFEAYWMSGPAHDAEGILPTAKPQALEELRATLAEQPETPQARDFSAAVSEFDSLKDLRKGRGEWCPVHMVVDDPRKGMRTIPRRQLAVDGIEKGLGQIAHSLDMASAYFVPGRFGMRYLSRLAERGVKLNILTNSVGSSDVPIVHSGYMKYRRRLLKRGAVLAELKPHVKPDARLRRYLRLRNLGKSQLSLHAKVFVADGRRVFLGSFNFDPRSVYLNCEMGMLIESEAIAADISRQIAYLQREQAYVAVIGKSRRLYWRDDSVAPPSLVRPEPNTTLWSRLAQRALGFLPIEWLL